MVVAASVEFLKKWVWITCKAISFEKDGRRGCLLEMACDLVLWEPVLCGMNGIDSARSAAQSP